MTPACPWCGGPATTYVMLDGHQVDVCRARERRIKADEAEQDAARKTRAAEGRRRAKALRESELLIDTTAPSAITEG